MLARFDLRPHLPLVAGLVLMGTLIMLSPVPAAAPLSPPAVPPSQTVVFPKVLRIEGIPAARDMLSVVEGSPFTVPPSKVFVVTGAGVQRYGALHNWILEIRFNGQLALTPSIDPAISGVVQIPAGLTAPAGTVITTSESGGQDPLTVSVVLGYLADA